MNAPPSIDWARLRKDFPILDQEINGHPLIYFDNAATSQKPRAVLDAIRRYYEHDNANVHRGIHELSNRATGAYEAARERVAKFINARAAQEIIPRYLRHLRVGQTEAQRGGDSLDRAQRGRRFFPQRHNSR